MTPQPRAGAFSPNPAQTLQTGISPSPHPPQAGVLSAGASPSTTSPTGPSNLTRFAVAQVYLLLSTIKEDQDRTKWELQAEQLRKLLDDHGMDVYSKYFSRLVAGNAPQIFPGLSRQVSTANNIHLLAQEMRLIAQDVDQARKIAESIESGTEDVFRDFDLSTFLEHFKLDAMEKTILALAFKLGSRSDLKTKADAILSTNFPAFLSILSRPNVSHGDMPPSFIAVIVDRVIQYHPPNFNSSSRDELAHKLQERYAFGDQPVPSAALAALDVGRLLAEKSPNALALYIHRTGLDFTRDEESCVAFLQNRPSNIQLSEERVSAALLYSTLSLTPQYSPSVLTAALRRVLPAAFRWQDVVSYFDQKSARITSAQFLGLYHALVPIAEDDQSFNIELLWGGNWEHPEAQLSFISAFASLQPEELDATTIPGLHPTVSLTTYTRSPPAIKERAAIAVKHPLNSQAALSAIFHVALHSVHASQSTEAKRLFQEVVVPNLDIFVVSAFGVPKPWPSMAVETLNSLVENFLYKRSENYDFVLESVWKVDKEWVVQRLSDAHAMKPLDLPLIFEHAVNHEWLEELVYLPSGLGFDLAALAHAEGYLDLGGWAARNIERKDEVAAALLQFLMIKAEQEGRYQRPPDGQPQVKTSTTLQVRTVSAMLQILEDFLPKEPRADVIGVQRHCIIVYPRLINYGEGFDDIIDANGRDGNALPAAANSRMEEHYKKMYGGEIQVRDIVEVLNRYKHSREPLDQDVFACMIHGLFDEYTHYVDYPLEALATTSVLFGGIISHKLVSELPLQIGLGMILEAVRDHSPDASMYKFGLQALMQLFSRFREWPGFCRQLLQIPGLQGTEAWKKADEVVRGLEEEVRHRGSAPGLRSTPYDSTANGGLDDDGSPEQKAAPFASINIDSPASDVDFEDPGGETQGKIQFGLNNLTESTLQTTYKELRELLGRRHQQWFASHLVEERAKMQPNYHHVYLELVRIFEDKLLWAEVLRETYISVSRMLNSDATMQNSTERAHLKNLGGWLGLLTLARDKPIKHKNIAFKQLLMEAHDTKRLIVVIPFVCKVLIQGALSAVFRPPNPWLMDIINLLIELYHHAELKLNLKFEIEVLCKGLNLDHKAIQPSGEILNRAIVEDSTEMLGQDALDGLESLSLNGLSAAVGNSIHPPAAVVSIPDLGPLITIPPANEMVVSPTRLHEIVRTALTRALGDIIQPVVDRSVTIAAISTQQMIHKDFATEPDEGRVRTSAVNMVKATAGSLAMVTSKEPLRANFTNYMRNLSNDLPQGLPEGTIIMCVNSNLDLACSIIEKQAEERAVPEIEEMIEPELEARRRHRLQRPNTEYIDSSLSRWALTMPHPFKLQPSASGLNQEQMAIYEDFARQSRSTPTTAASHVPSTSDASRSLANEILQDQFSSLPAIPTPAETPSIQQLHTHVQPYPPLQAGGVPNGRLPFQLEMRSMAERVGKILHELQRVSADAREQHFEDLPRGHALLDVVDALVQLIIKTTQSSEEIAVYAADLICRAIFGPVEANLTMEALVHVLETVRRVGGVAVNTHVLAFFRNQQGQAFLNPIMLAALLRTDLLDWRIIDAAMANLLQQRKEGSLEFLKAVLDLTVLNKRPLALYADFVRSLEVAWPWIMEDPSAAARDLKKELAGPTPPQAPATVGENHSPHELLEYVFDEWVHLTSNPNASDSSAIAFLEQMQVHSIITDKDDLFVFIRLAIDISVERFEQCLFANGNPIDGYAATDALAKLVGILVRTGAGPPARGGESRVETLGSILIVAALVLNHHHTTRGEAFNQKVFYRLFSMILHEINDVAELDEGELVLKLASRLVELGPRYLPGFLFGWLALVQHRMFLPVVLRLPNRSGWPIVTKLLRQLLSYVGDQLKAVELNSLVKDIYRSTLKLLVVLSHDYPDYLSAHYTQLAAAIPNHCPQLLAFVLGTTPQATSKLQDSLHPGFKGEGAGDSTELFPPLEDSLAVLKSLGLLEMVEHTLQRGPAEDMVAQLAHAITHPTTRDLRFGNVPMKSNLDVITAIIQVIGNFAVERASQTGGPVFVPSASDTLTISLLVHELPPEPRYYFLGCIVSQLRFPSAHTKYFSQVLVELFGHDVNDPEESEIRQQITRLLFERLAGYWPHTWGLLVTVVDLMKNDAVPFFDLPFVKAAPEVAGRFMTVLDRT